MKASAGADRLSVGMEQRTINAAMINASFRTRLTD
jgi:hypothetical protein